MGWARAGNLAELWWSRHAGLPWETLAENRLRLLVRHAREQSPFYRRRYARLGPDPPLHELPPVAKPALMAKFDAWSTDRAVTRASVEAFLADRGNIGGHYLGRYAAWKSSGTTSTPGIFVQDEAALAVYDALVDVQLEGEAFAAALATMGALPRAALVVATNDHFASIVSWTRLAAATPGLVARAFPVLDPLPRLCAELEAFQPDYLAAYPSVLAMLAAEQRAGRLAIDPALVWSGGETLTRAARTRIAHAFRAPVMNEYGASECLSIASECDHGWMHLNAEWVILEGIDAAGRPAAPRQASDRVLLTNLANHLQPVIRYELDDRIVSLGGPCPCGDPRPAFRVEGREGQVVRLADRDGHRVPVAPLAIETVVEEAARGARFQVAQVGDASLVLRHDEGGDRERMREALRDFLAGQSLANVRVRLDAGGPRVDARSGKLHTVVVEARGR